MPRTIPQIRARLLELAFETGIDELAELARETYRRQGVRRAPVRSPPLTEQQKEAIRAYVRQHPTAHQQDVAQRFGTNHGRVSEALIGKRST